MSRKSRARGPKPGEWKYAVGEAPHLLTAWERADKGLAIYTRLWDGRRYVQRKALCGPIRDKAGRIMPEREIEAQQLAVRRHAEIVAGIEAEAAIGGPLTLAGGFRQLLHPREGRYAGDTTHRRDVLRYAKMIRAVLGSDLRWDEIRPRHYRALWRHLAHAHVKEKKYGMRTAEMACAILQTAARWLQQEGLIEPGDAMPAPGWKQTLKNEWAEITDKPIARPAKPRYSEAEAAKLWAVLPKADPRVQLAIEIGAELRMGQVIRARRSDVQPSPDGRFRIGTVIIHGRGKKHGAAVVLTRRQRHVLTRALLWGHLAIPEAAYRAGEIDDYHLIPSGRLHGAKDHRGREVKRIRIEGAGKPMTPRTLARHWENLEQLAKVDHQDGRLWYGMRRLQADAADALPDVEARVKNQLGAWTKTSTREGYLEEATVRDAVEAARVRDQIRPEGPKRKARQ